MNNKPKKYAAITEENKEQIYTDLGLYIEPRIVISSGEKFPEEEQDKHQWFEDHWYDRNPTDDSLGSLSGFAARHNIREISLVEIVHICDAWTAIEAACRIPGHVGFKRELSLTLSSHVRDRLVAAKDAKDAKDTEEVAVRAFDLVQASLEGVVSPRDLQNALKGTYWDYLGIPNAGEALKEASQKFLHLRCQNHLAEDTLSSIIARELYWYKRSLEG